MGLLNPLYEVVAWVVQQIHGGLSQVFGPATGLTWALTIVLLVVLVRLILFPLFVKQIHAQRKMADLAPQVQELRKKYKNDKQRMNQEVMKLYQENGANPLTGCLPLVLQFPVFISLFQVLKAIADDKPQYGLKPAVVASAQHAHIFGVTVATTFRDAVFHPSLLTEAGVNRAVAMVVVGITVLISGATTYLTMRQSMRRSVTPSMSDNPMMQSQKMMAYVAPLFALSGLYWQYGLVLYWVCTNLWTMGQQRYIFKKYPQPAASGESAAQPAAGAATGPRKPVQAKGDAARTASAGTAKSGTARTGTARTGTARTGTARTGTAKSGTASAGTAKSGTARTGTARTGTAKSGTASAGTAKSGTARTGTARTGTAKSGAAANGTAKDGTSKRGAESGAAAKDGAAKGGAPADGDQARAGSSTGRTTTGTRSLTAAAKAGAGQSAKDGQGGLGIGRLLRRGQEPREPENPPDAEEQPKIVRRQPVRQSRSKRSGK